MPDQTGWINLADASVCLFRACCVRLL